jgi:hypothetical protein
VSNPVAFEGSEAWVGELLRMLPDASILKHYVFYAAQVTDANAGHHVPMGLVLLSQAGPDLGIVLADHSTFNNLYALVTASSGARKTECLKIGRKVANMAGLHTALVPTPGSREGFIDALDVNMGGHAKQALIYNEFADFLGITAAQGRGRMAGHATTLRSAIMDAYDGQPVVRQLAGRRERDSSETTREVRGTQTPRVSLIGASNYRVLSKHTTADDWLDGFMGRFFLTHGEMHRFYFRPRGWPVEMQAVASELQRRRAQEAERSLRRMLSDGGKFPTPAGDDTTPDAEARLESWAYEMRKRATNAHPLVAAAMQRLTPLTLRIALMLSWDYGQAKTAAEHDADGWRLTLNEIEPAIFLAERHLDAYEYAVANVVLNEEERPVRDIEQAVRHADNNGAGLTFGEVSEKTSRVERTVKEALSTLMHRRTITKRQRRDTAHEEFIITNGIAHRVVMMRQREEPSVNMADLFGEPALPG